MTCVITEYPYKEELSTLNTFIYKNSKHTFTFFIGYLTSPSTADLHFRNFIIFLSKSNSCSSIVKFNACGSRAKMLKMLREGEGEGEGNMKFMLLLRLTFKFFSFKLNKKKTKKREKNEKKITKKKK